ncbi:MAG: restriction endonuclease subunit S [Lachnospiraceae bacterium]|nr:restriction endonuclease subunit S [Lachnospiraceae bacterium]
MPTTERYSKLLAQIQICGDDEMRMQKIEDACTLHARIGWQGLTKAEYLDSGDYYLVTGVDFLDGVIDFQNCHYVTKDRYDQDSHIQLQENDVLVTKDGTIGKVAIVDKFDKPATLNSGVFVVRPRNEEALLPTYLVYALRSGSFIRFIEQIKVGCTIAHLNQAKFLKFEIPDIGVQEQRKVVNILSRTEEILKKRRQQLEELDNLIKSRFVELFGDTVLNPFGWEKDSLGSVCDVRDGTHDSPKYYETGYPLVTSKNVTGGKIDLTGCSLICEADFNKINERSKVDSGDIIMPMIGTVGKPVIVDIEPDFAIKNVALIKFRADSSVLNIYIRALLQSDYFDDAVLSKVRGGTQKFISLGDIRKLEILVPPMDIQKQFVEFVKQVDKLKVEVQKSLDETQQLMDSLMQKHFG